MKTTNTRSFWSGLLVVVGGIAMLAGALDPLEGSLIILPGAGLVTLGTFLGKSARGLCTYWLWIFLLMAAGVGALFILSAFGGIGGSRGHSMWWGVLLLPYPIAWVMGMVSLLFRVVRRLQHRPVAA
jgi:purine-cytosine permease-like protein